MLPLLSLDQGSWASIHALEGGVDLDDGDVHAGPGALVLALPGDPRLERLELTAEGQDLQGRRGRVRGQVGEG